MKKFFLFLVILSSFSIFNSSCAQPLNKKKEYTRQDTLRGSITPERAWWDVQHYDVAVKPDYDTKTITGKTIIAYKVIADKHSDYMQIDLQKPLLVDTIFYDGKMYINYPGKPYYNEGNVWHIPLPKAVKNSLHTIAIAYHGKPREAITPPWDGGWIWKKDRQGRPWMTVACQGLGASVWYPCKDYQGDEPDGGARLEITVPDSLVAVGNGRLKEQRNNEDGTTTWIWEVKSPINNYTIIPYIGKYVHWHENYAGEKGNLDLDYWALDYDKEQAEKQFTQVKDMMKCFEYWLGPYPFYEDGYKLVEASHLGMEHQSAVAYGNISRAGKFMNGYLGSDLSGTGWGLKWDYIIVHESGHEWFANNITTNDIADMWVHEGITDYAETLFVECQSGKEAGNAYTQGLRKNIANDRPIIGPYGVNQEGSEDMYFKGSQLMHIIRQEVDNDSLFRSILRGLTETFYHKIVDTKDIETYITRRSGKDLSKIFDQYLRSTEVPVLEYKNEGNRTSYRWTHCIAGFNMPVKLEGSNEWLSPTTDWKERKSTGPIQVDKNFYVLVKNVGS
jgi:aminopeptidase N